MKYNELKLVAKKSNNRKGRGISAGQGKTAGRGTKGQNSRTGGGVRLGFEGGQSPLAQRLPKLRGFKSKRPKTENVYTAQLNEMGAKIDNFTLYENSIISSPYVNVKLIYNGELTKKVSVSMQGASKTAIKSVEKAGGSFKVISRPQRASKKSD
jgi:large subunit ribosomal protein L15